RWCGLTSSSTQWDSWPRECSPSSTSAEPGSGGIGWGSLSVHRWVENEPADGGRLGRVSPPVPIFPCHGRREAVLNPEPRRTPMRSFLPMANHVRGKRSPVTCALKCDNACLKATCNTSSNGYFRDIVDAKL